jgi:hypothetical protein
VSILVKKPFIFEHQTAAQNSELQPHMKFLVPKPQSVLQQIGKAAVLRERKPQPLSAETLH